VLFRSLTLLNFEFIPPSVPTNPDDVVTSTLSRADVAQMAERNEILKIKQEKTDLDESNFRNFEQIMIEGRKVRLQREQEEKEALAVSGGNGESITVTSVPTPQVKPFSGEEIVQLVENEELRAIRMKKLAHLTEQATSPATVSHVTDISATPAASATPTSGDIWKPLNIESIDDCSDMDNNDDINEDEEEEEEEVEEEGEEEEEEEEEEEKEGEEEEGEGEGREEHEREEVGGRAEREDEMKRDTVKRQERE